MWTGTPDVTIGTVQTGTVVYQAYLDKKVADKAAAAAAAKAIADAKAAADAAAKAIADAKAAADATAKAIANT